jgi:hypothetical protein
MRDLVLPMDLGIPVSLLNVDRYIVPVEAQTLAPEDEALLGVSIAPKHPSDLITQLRKREEENHLMVIISWRELHEGLLQPDPPPRLLILTDWRRKR